MKKNIDAKTGRAVFQFRKKNIHVSLEGIDMETISYLALHGLHDILNKRRNPEKSWGQIKQGTITPKKTIPNIIKAISSVYQLTINQAINKWSSLSKKQKYLLKKDTRIRQFMMQQENSIEIDIDDIST